MRRVSLIRSLRYITLGFDMLSQDEYLEKVNPIRQPVQSDTVCGLDFLNEWLKLEEDSFGKPINMVPDFQRGHVWTHDQQTKFIENVLRGLVDKSGLTIRFNHPTKEALNHTNDITCEIICLDGLQRLESLKQFLAGNILPFGMSYAEIPRVFIRNIRIHFQIYDFTNRSDILAFYLDINSGGTPHSNEEIQRVQSLLAESL